MPSWQRKKYFKLAKGFYGRAKNCLRIAIPRVEKSLQYAYRDRRVKRRDFRKEWIQAINAGVREHYINYSTFIYGLNKSNIELNRKILADLAINEPYSFKAVVDEIKLKPYVQAKPQPRKPQEEMDYFEAMSKGYIIEGDVKPREPKELKLPFFGLRFPEKFNTPEAMADLKRR